MNAVEIEEAVSALASAPFDPAAFPYAFLTAFGMKDATVARLRKGDTNASDVGGVLQRGNIHIALAVPGGVNDTLRALRESPKTATAKAKFILATDGQTLEAEDLVSGEPLACSYQEFADHFGFFLPLAGISTVKELKNNPIDVKATGRLNRLYVELLKENAEWGTPERRHDLNQFMARLIFCFFAEDTGIFNGTNLFTSTLERMSTTEAGSVEHVLTELFRAMDIAPDKRQDAKLRSWADAFPYVNGGLFAGGKPCPRFSKIARSYLLRAGELNWREINPDIFGSMIQAVADEGERGSLGMHYTSVPNIMKVLGPLFLDDLRAQLEAAGDNVRKLRNLRRRLANIRVFDPACGSGNFLVIAYIRMREIEHEIVKLTDDEPRSMIPLSNFYGIEIKDFAAEIARLALLIAEFQCDVRFISQHVARSLVLPLKKTGQIKTGNALRENWLSICQPVAPAKEEYSLTDHLGRQELEKSQDFSVEFETFICGNPPYKGVKNQTDEQKDEMEIVFSGVSDSYKNLDYVACWFVKASRYISDSSNKNTTKAAFVSTNSICQGSQVPALWPIIFSYGQQILFAHTSFLWKNLAAHNAGVTVAVVGFGKPTTSPRKLYSILRDGSPLVKDVVHINAYLIPGKDIIINKSSASISGLPKMNLGNQPYEGNHLIFDGSEINALALSSSDMEKYTRRLYGSSEFIRGGIRYCLWLEDSLVQDALEIKGINDQVEKVRKWRLQSERPATRAMASRPHQFCEMNFGRSHTFIVPIRSSENREYLPVGILNHKSVVSNLAYALYDAPIWCLSILASRIHLSWIAAVCGRMKNDYSYSNKMGWNTFPLPVLTEQNKSDLSRCAEKILLAREALYPATIADLYDPEKMPDNLREAHELNDETLDRIYIGRRFRNDTERLEKLFELYTRMTAAEAQAVTAKKPASRGRSRAAAGAV